MPSARTTTAALALLLAACAGAAQDRFLADVQALTRTDHRLSGTPEYAAAADHVAERLRAIGADEVIVQDFPSLQTRVSQCTLEIAGRPAPLDILPLRPNGIVPPATPPDGITGALLHAGKGGVDDYRDASPRDRIVVLDYNCGRAWLRAFRLGARAVVFVRKDPTEAWHTHYLHANANLPRFYYKGDPADLPDGAVATVRSAVTWRPTMGRNVLALFRGTQPTFQQDGEELIVLAANLDTFGEVPRLSPGARGAANCAALLAIAEHLEAHRPRRHVLLAFLDNQARGHAGCAAFYRAIDQSERTNKLENRREYLENEQAFLKEMRRVLESGQPLAQASPVRREMVSRLKRFAAAEAFDIRTALHRQRVALEELDDGSPEHAQLQRTIGEAVARKDRWNELLRALARDRDTANVRSQLAAALAQVGRDVAERATELEGEAAALAADQRVHDRIGKAIIVLHISLLLGDASPHYGLLVGGDSSLHTRSDDAGLYGKIQGTFLAAGQALSEAPVPPRRFERASADGSLDPPRLLWSAPFLIHSGEMAGRLGYYNLAIGTTQESLKREGTPDDTAGQVDLPRIREQAAELAPLLAAVASQEGLSLRRSIVADNFYVFPEFPTDNRPRGPMVMGRLPGSSLPDRPMPNAIVQILLRRRGAPPYHDLLHNPARPYAFDDFMLVRSNRNGSYGFGPVQKAVWTLTGFAAVFDQRGLVSSTCDLDSARTVVSRFNTFRCHSGVVVLPPLLDALPAQIFRARGSSPLDNDRSYYQTLDGVVHWFCEEKVDAVKLFGLRSMVSLVNGGESLSTMPEAADPQGAGMPVGRGWHPPSSARRAATDLWRLNESRLKVLRARGIMNSSVEELHGRAEDLLLEAEESPSVTEGEALAASAFLAERPVYEITRSTLNDLVRAVLVLLALSVPFAFAIERLLVGATTIYRQIGWFAGFFSLTFLVLYLSHPAFAIAKTPVIIFLGFAIVVLAALVITIIMRRFEVELKVFQGLTSTVHAADVSRFSTIMAAMSMGISTMRRRPLRTALTAITIIMLTFTILCFASFGTQTGIVKLFVGPTPGYTGLFLHKVNWAELNPDLLDVLGSRWPARPLCRRYWVSPRTQQNQGPIVTRADGSRPLALRGVLGLDASEFSHRTDLAALFGADRARWDSVVLLTRAVAERLGLKSGDPVLVGGLALRVGTVLDASAVAAAKDMDGNGVLPVDFVEMQSALGGTTDDEEALTAQSEQNWAYLPTDSVVIVSARNAQLMGASLHAVTLYTPDARSAMALTEEVARVFPLPVSATRADGVYRHVLGTLVQASGAGDLVFPIVLGGLVIFGTMLGSVADREKEIYTFSSLGLAPPHVASLFFAEAMVYSVLGGLAGYLIAQATMKILSFLADYGLVTVPEMNYSSANAIVTILIVMGTVLVSAAYPAIKASRSANPGILRTWRIPPPHGDVFDIVFPFTVSEYDITGVVSFLKEHFDNFGDTGLGVFMARDARVVRAPDGALGLDAELALAPFDLGVTQGFELRSAASEIAGIDEVAIRLTRTSGQPKDWKRLNKVLLDDLRRQFLIWRALPHETMEIYRQRTLVAMGMAKERAARERDDEPPPEPTTEDND